MTSDLVVWGTDFGSAREHGRMQDAEAGADARTVVVAGLGYCRTGSTTSGVEVGAGDGV